MYPQVGLMPWEQEVRGQFGLFKLPVLSTHLCGPWLSSGQNANRLKQGLSPTGLCVVGGALRGSCSLPPPPSSGEARPPHGPVLRAPGAGAWAVRGSTQQLTALVALRSDCWTQFE